MLTSVVLLLPSSLEALPHVAQCIESFLDRSPLWTLESAAAGRHVLLLDRLLTLEHPSVGRIFRFERFLHGASKAVEDENLDVLLWWTTKYLPGEPLRSYELSQSAARLGHVHDLQWLQQMGLFPAHEGQRLVCGHADVVYWLHSQPALRVHVTVWMDTAAESGDLEFIKWLQRHRDQYDVQCSKAALAAANERGDLEMLQWLLANRAELLSSADETLSECALAQRKWPYPSDYLELPDPLEVTEGHLRVFRWLGTEYQWTNTSSENTERWAAKVAMHAAACNNLEMIQILHSLHAQGSCRFDRPAWTTAFFGHLEMVQWLYKEADSCLIKAAEGAAVGGHLHILQWLWNQDPELQRDVAMDLAAWSGHLIVVKWMHQARTSHSNLDSFACTPRAMDAAAGQGHLDVVKWLHENRTEGCTTLAMDQAAANGHLKIVQFLHSHRHEGYTSDAMTEAASNGHLEVVRWLHDNRPQAWKQGAVDQAAVNGHTQVLEFLTLECQLQCSALARKKAKRQGHFAVVEWLHVHAPMPERRHFCCLSMEM